MSDIDFDKSLRHNLGKSLVIACQKFEQMKTCYNNPSEHTMRDLELSIWRAKSALTSMCTICDIYKDKVAERAFNTYEKGGV